MGSLKIKLRMRGYLILMIIYFSALEARAMYKNDIFDEFSDQEIMLVCNFIRNGEIDATMRNTQSFLEIKEMCDFLMYSMNRNKSKWVKMVPPSKGNRHWIR